MTKKITAITIAFLMAAASVFVPGIAPASVSAAAEDPYNVEKLEGTI